MLYLYSEVVLMLAIRLPQSIEKRLEQLARPTGPTKTAKRSSNTWRIWRTCIWPNAPWNAFAAAKSAPSR